MGDFSLSAQSEVCLLPWGFYRVGDKFRNKRFVNIGKDTIESLGLCGRWQDKTDIWDDKNQNPKKNPFVLWPKK